jgi:charged multivesicular body protein 5
MILSSYLAVYIYNQAKIAALDKELKTFRDKLKQTKNPAAKKNIQKRAMDVLKRKRMYETQRDQLMGQQFNIDQAAFGIDSAKASVATVAAMKAANTELKATLKNDLKIDDVDALADDMAELMEEFQEINEVLAQNFATPDDIDEADLEAELDMLEDELEQDLVGDTESVPSYLQTSLPSLPTAAPGSKVPVAAGASAPSAPKVDEYGLPVEY